MIKCTIFLKLFYLGGVFPVFWFINFSRLYFIMLRCYVVFYTASWYILGFFIQNYLIMFNRNDFNIISDFLYEFVHMFGETFFAVTFVVIIFWRNLLIFLLLFYIVILYCYGFSKTLILEVLSYIFGTFLGCFNYKFFLCCNISYCFVLSFFFNLSFYLFVKFFDLLFSFFSSIIYPVESNTDNTILPFI